MDFKLNCKANAEQLVTKSGTNEYYYLKGRLTSREFLTSR